ncbi:MAG: hypothetical protein IKP46_07075 [Bacteroidales bacterium]|nr:hypothetical protein [Bacteroidales bacterium]
MRTTIISLAVLLALSLGQAAAQPWGYGTPPPQQQGMPPPPPPQGTPPPDGAQPSHHHGTPPPPPPGQHGPRRPHREVRCTDDWQELWNGCHVRLSLDRVCIHEADGDKLLSGDEVTLLPSGRYKVRIGNIWRVFESDGDRTEISGEEIVPWPGGRFAVRFGENWHVYTPGGNRVPNVWGESVSLMSNGLIRCRRNGMVHYYDAEGNERR